MSRTIRLFSAAVLAICLTASTPSHADKPRLVVVPLAFGEGASEVAAGKFQRLLIDELKTRTEVIELATPPAVKAAAPDKPATGGKRGPSTEAVNALAAGKAAFDELRFEDAVASYKKGLEGLLIDPASADFDAVIDAQLKVAAGYFRLGEEKNAKLALRDLCRLSPAYQLPPGYPPVFQRELDKAKNWVEKQPHGQLSIEGPGGATAFVDGRDLGMVPVLEENLAAGVHYVRVEGVKGERYGTAVEVKSGVVKVKGSFGGAASERAVVKPGEGPVADPKVSSLVDEATKERVVAYAKAASADCALVGYVYKTSDTQLTAGAALLTVKTGAFSPLAAVSFDPEVVTANTEAFKLVDEALKKVVSAGAPAVLPLNLATRPHSALLAKVEPKAVRPDELDGSSLGPARTPAKVVLVPQETKPSARTLENPAAVVELEKTERPDDGPPLMQPVKVPVWVWILTGVAVAAGAGVGGYFVVTEATRPVTGTVTASW